MQNGKENTIPAPILNSLNQFNFKPKKTENVKQENVTKIIKSEKEISTTPSDKSKPKQKTTPEKTHHNISNKVNNGEKYLLRGKVVLSSAATEKTFLSDKNEKENMLPRKVGPPAASKVTTTTPQRHQAPPSQPTAQPQPPPATTTTSNHTSPVAPAPH